MFSLQDYGRADRIMHAKHWALKSETLSASGLPRTVTQVAHCTCALSQEVGKNPACILIIKLCGLVQAVTSWEEGKSF